MKDRVLIVAKDDEFKTRLADTLEATGDYLTVTATTFEEALSEILLAEFSLIVTETELPDLSGMDLLAVVGGLRPGTSVMMIDDDLSAKSAVAAIRLGACDYLHKPINMHFLLMQIERQIDVMHMTKKKKESEETHREIVPPTPRDRERQLNPATRPAALLLGREQFQVINQELQRLLGHIKAHFVGLVDSDGNLAGAAGTLEEYDLVLLTRALSIDHTATSTLATILEENQFHSTYLEGEHNGVYIVEIEKPYLLSLAVICSVDVKPGMVWLYSKRTAETISQVLKASPQSPQAATLSL
jgi:DNA-binding response OmpR family regulator/predicted regulator of Ras-like GTPase activity (Roadblock/LC7/MglB family)